jgi:hypothetical protein
MAGNNGKRFSWFPGFRNGYNLPIKIKQET